MEGIFLETIFHSGAELTTVVLNQFQSFQPQILYSVLIPRKLLSTPVVDFCSLAKPFRLHVTSLCAFTLSPVSHTVPPSPFCLPYPSPSPTGTRLGTPLGTSLPLLWGGCPYPCIVDSNSIWSLGEPTLGSMRNIMGGEPGLTDIWVLVLRGHFGG